ncbi:putative leucine-rich repeat receptor-like protein kinase [Glycine soja]
MKVLVLNQLRSCKKVACHQLDILDPSSINQFADWLKENYGGLDILGEQMLVYEHIPNGTLMDSLSGKSGIWMDWIRRLKVALGAARGIRKNLNCGETDSRKPVHPQMRGRIELLLKQNKLSEKHIKDLLQEYHDNIGDLDGPKEKERAQTKIQKFITAL